MRLLYRFLREHKPEYFHGRLIATVNGVIQHKINASSTYEEFSALV
jgi:hypothetical protein